jgi:ParB family chromosome partitioning protein
MNQATLTTLPVEDIVFDSKQPRKFFDQVAHGELTESIKQVGVLQPIMVRPGGTVTGGGGKANRKAYMIICGERRYRAAYEAGLKEIPVVIREGLSDEEVMEIQIIENLQRKDVNPMEEGHAFEKLSQRFSIEEIALRVGKSAQYVAQRISLTNLTDGWQQLMYEGEITLTQAYKLARLAPSVQDDGYKKVVRNGKMNNRWELDNLLDDTDHDLDQATFNTEDENLHPEVGACGSCRYNSASSNLLFPDLNTKRICHNSACFNNKTEISYKINLEEKAKDPDMLFVSLAYSLDNEDKAKIKAAQDLGLTVLGYKDFDVIHEPGPILQSWEEYLAESKEDNEFEDMDEADQKEFIRDLRDEYDDDLKTYERDLAQFQVDSQNAKKAFVVAGDGWRGKEGQIIVVAPKTGGKGMATLPGGPENSELNAFEKELEGIRTRNSRNAELDREKIQLNICGLFEDESKFLSDESDLLQTEENALIYAMCEHSYTTKHYVEELLGKVSRKATHLYAAISVSRGVLNLPNVARVFIADKLVNKNAMLDPERWGNAAAMHELAEVHFPTELSKFKADQAEKAKKREANVAKRIEALEQKIAALKEEKTRSENEAAAKKEKSNRA